MKTWFPMEQYSSDTSRASRRGSHIPEFCCDDPEILAFLGKLSLLIGVPLCDLVPDQRMLPPESVRFFYLDPNWIECLLDGALSIGNSSSADEAHDRAVRDSLMDSVRYLSVNLRRRRLGISGDTESSDEQKSGFFLRSSLAAGYPGMELKCFEGKKELEILRYDIIAEDILLCIANGCVDTVAFCEPVESVHFGFKMSGQGELFKRLVSTKLEELGEPLEKNISPVFRQGGKRVLDIAAFTEGIKSELPKEHTGPYFSSLEFAAQMIDRQIRYELFVAEDNGGASENE